VFAHPSSESSFAFHLHQHVRTSKLVRCWRHHVDSNLWLFLFPNLIGTAVATILGASKNKSSTGCLYNPLNIVGGAICSEIKRTGAGHAYVDGTRSGRGGPYRRRVVREKRRR
jgi:hypothetical protein